MLDADNTPLKNPEVLFDSKEYREGGNLYWPDWWDAQGWLRPAAYRLFGITPPWTVPGQEVFRTAESGQMVLNRHARFLVPVHGIASPQASGGAAALPALGSHVDLPGGSAVHACNAATRSNTPTLTASADPIQRHSAAALFLKWPACLPAGCGMRMSWSGSGS